MKKIQMTMATSHVDLHGDRILPSALEAAVRQIRKQYLPLIKEHDIRYPPRGRVVSAEVIKLHDGEYALQGTAEVFEESDSIESLTGDGRKIPIRDQIFKLLLSDITIVLRTQKDKNFFVSFHI